MIKKLTERLKLNKELLTIKKHLRTAKRHKSCNELESVKFELLDFQGKLIESGNKTACEHLEWEMYSLFTEIDYARNKYAPAISRPCTPFI